MLACRMGVIFTMPALVLNSSTGRPVCAKLAKPANKQTIIFIITEIVAGDRFLKD
jgi:hypothetical protein